MEQDNFAENQIAQSAPAVPAPVAQAAEKMVPQSKVDEIVRHSNARVAEKARKDALEQYQAQQQPQQSSTSMGGMERLTTDDMRRIAAEEAQKNYQSVVQQHQEEQMKHEGRRVVNEFFGKLNAAKERYPDIEEVVGSLPLDKIAHIVGLANTTEGTADIMYELGKNKEKLAHVHALMSIDPELARAKLSDLVKSVQINEQAKNQRLANEPLSRISASPVGVDNGSNMTVSDYRKKFRSR